MNIKVDISFEKDFLKIKDEKIKTKVVLKMEEISTTLSLRNILWVSTIKWFNWYFRIKIWNYRIWIKKDNNILVFIRIKHRKDIYKVFP